MKGAIYIFSAGDGDAQPRLVAQARLVAGRIECEDASYRDWLQGAVDQIARDAPAPNDGEELDRFIEEVCAQRSGVRLFASPTPIP